MNFFFDLHEITYTTQLRLEMKKKELWFKFYKCEYLLYDNIIR